MFAWVGAALGIVNKLLGAVGWFQKRSDEDLQREAGATAQREADQKETINAQRDQLQKAADHKPGAARKRLRDGNF
jgi:hypothetical protein